MVIRPSPELSPSAAAVGDESRTWNVSLGSRAVSPLTVTDTVLVVSPAAKVTVVRPTAAESVGAVAVQPA